MGSLRFSEFADSPSILIPPPNVHSFYPSAHSHYTPHYHHPKPAARSSPSPAPAEPHSSNGSSRKRSRNEEGGDAAACSHPKVLRTSSKPARHNKGLDNAASGADISAKPGRAEETVSRSPEVAGTNHASPPQSADPVPGPNHDVEMTVFDLDTSNMHSSNAEGETESSAVSYSSFVDPFADNNESRPDSEDHPFDGIVTHRTVSGVNGRPIDLANGVAPDRDPSYTGSDVPFDGEVRSVADDSDITMS